MDMKYLFNGIAVVIDDEINDPKANIGNIVKQIESADIPILKYTKLPSEKVIRHFHNLSFLLLDWRLIKEGVTNDEIAEGVTIPDTLQEYDETENIEFIKKLNEECFCPIFIFTNEDAGSIQSSLKEQKLMETDRPSNLFVQSKSDLQNENELFNQVSEWLQSTPSVYVLKEWEREYQNSKDRLFSEFHIINPAWPTIMWKNFEADGANKSLEMGGLISRNLHSRMTPFEFNDEILDKNSEVPRDELRKVLEGERFLNRNSLHDDDISTGDLFKEEYQDNSETKYRYYLNIRAQCDLLRSNNADKVELYCLKGRIFDENKINNEGGSTIIEGQFIEKINNSIVPFLDGGQIIEFLFRDIKPKKWKDLKEKRVGRLLPPYINRIQQRYALYMQRQGLPRIPDAAIFDNSTSGNS
jgi:hypothetical protein